MKNQLKLTISALVIATLGLTVPANAQFKDLKNLAKKETKKKAVKEIKKQLSQPAPTPSSQQHETQMASAGSPQLGTPAANLRSLTNCASLRPSNIIIGTLGDYTFSQGMSSEKRRGLKTP